MLISFTQLYGQKSTGINNTNPNLKAALDISTSGTQGILIPRLPSSSKATFGLTTAEKGMIFYGSDTDSIYYWTGVKWVSLALNGPPISTNYWGLDGNTISTSNFLGSTNARDIIFKVNNVNRMKLRQNGSLFIYGTSRNTFIGDSAGYNSTGGSNTFVGFNAGLKNITGTNNTFLGYQAGINDNGTGGSTYLGNQAGYNTTSGFLNTFVGNSAGYSNLIGTSNAYFGTNSGFSSSGSNNTFVGTNAGLTNTTGSTNTMLGSGADVVTGALTNATAIGYNAKVAKSNAVVLGNTGIDVGIGITTPNAPLQFSNAIENRKIVLYEGFNNDHQYYGFGVNGGTLRYQTDAVAADHVFYSAISAIASRELMRITGDGMVGIGVNPTATLSVAGTSSQVAHIGNVFSGNYAGITLNGTISDGSYNLLSSSLDPNLYINRATGNSIQFRENNVTQLTLNSAGDNIARTAHAVLTSANTWGTSLNIANSSTSGSTYSIVSTGAGHPMGAGSFVIQDAFSTNYAFVLNSLNGDTHLNATTNTGSCVGIGYSNPATNLAGTQRLQVNGAVLATAFNVSSDERYKKNILTILNTLPNIRKMRGVIYNWKKEDFPNINFNDKVQIGVIAQEVEQYYPELISTDNNGYKSVDYPKFTPILLQAVKELDTIIQTQEIKLNKLEYENKLKQNEIGELKAEINTIREYLKLNSIEGSTVKANDK